MQSRLIQPRPADTPIPLTPAQLRMWKDANERKHGLSARNCSLPLHVLGPLDVTALKRALAAVVKRHESLRTTIEVTDGIPFQRVDSTAAFALEICDLSALAPLTARAEATRLGTQLMTEEVSFAAGPLFAATLFRVSATEHILILALDHIITDGTSNHLLCRDLWTLYREMLSGTPAALPPLPVQFADYAVWLAQTRDGWLANHEEYWRTRLTGVPPLGPRVHHSAIDRNESAAAKVEVPFGAELSATLRDLARQEKALLPLVVLAAQAAAVARWRGQDDLIIKFATSARSRREIQNIIGFIASPLHLRVQISQSDSFVSVVRKVDREFRAAYVHQDFGYVCDMFPEYASEMLFNWLPKASEPAARDEEPQIRPFPLDAGWIPQLPWLCLFFSDTGTDIVMTARPRLGAFSAGELQQFANRLRQFTEQACGSPNTALVSL